MPKVSWTVNVRDVDRYMDVWKRYWRESQKESELPTLVRCLLDGSNAIHSRQNLGGRMDGIENFLNGFKACEHEGKKWEEGVDVGQELGELLKIYKDAYTQLCEKEAYGMSNLVEEMKRFISVYDERVKVRNKYNQLMNKLEEQDEGEENE